MVERMHRHDAALAALANEHARHRTIDGTRGMNATREPLSRHDGVSVSISVENRRGIKPAPARGIEEPSSIVIGSPAPRLRAGPSPAELRIHDPLPTREWRPAQPHTKRSPTVSVSPAVGEGPIGIQIGESRNVGRGTGVLHRRGRGGGDAVDAAGDPAIEVIFIGKAADLQGRIVAGLYRKGLALFKLRRVLMVQNGNAAFIGFDRAAVVIIVKAEAAPAIGFHGKVAPGDAEIVAARRIHIEGGAPLSQNEARGARSVIEGKVVELQDRVFLEESHRAVLELHFRAAVVRGKNIALADGQIQPGGFPACVSVRQRVAVGLPGESHVALNKAEADDAGMARVRHCGIRAHEQGPKQQE